jgi:hypothetical protein
VDGLKRRIVELESEKAESERAMRELQALMQNPRGGITEVEARLPPRGEAELRSALVRDEKVRVQNEELQLRLGKA